MVMASHSYETTVRREAALVDEEDLSKLSWIGMLGEV